MRNANPVHPFQGLLPRLWMFALRLSGDTYMAERLVERTYARVLEGATGPLPDSLPMVKLFAAMHSVWRAGLDRSPFEIAPYAQEDERRSPCADRTTHPPDDESMDQRIVDAIESLPQTLRIPAILVLVEGLNYEDASAVLDQTIESTRENVLHARLMIGSSLRLPCA